MNNFQHFFSGLKESFHTFWEDSKHRKAVLLAGCAVVIGCASIGAAFAARTTFAAAPADTDASQSVSLHITSVQPLADTDTSLLDSSSEAVKPDVKVQLEVSSATQDLNVNIKNESGALLTGVNFNVHIKGLDSENSSYDKTFEIDLLDGNLYLVWIPAGNYEISLAEQEGYIMPEPTAFEVKEFVVDYKKIDNIAEQVVDESKVDVKTEDSAYGTTETPAPPQDTVGFVDKSETSKDITKTDANGNTLYTYTLSTGANGFLLRSDGTESDILPTYPNGTSGIPVGKRYANIGMTDTVTLTLAQNTALFPGNGRAVGVTPMLFPYFEPSDSTAAGYAVTFQNPDGAVLSTVEVTPGGTANPPANPAYQKDGYLFFFNRWSGDYTNVQGNLTLTAIYTIFQYQGDVALTNADNSPVGGYQITAIPQTETVTLYTGWQTLEGKTYYYTADHQKVTGWQVIQGISYFFDSNGVRSDCLGIDVSRWNNSIDWNAVKNSGINFAIIRVGYRGYGSGQLVEDPYARANLSGAAAAGIKVGVYFFSQAVNVEEAIEEASMALDVARNYSLAYPIFIDSEYSNPAKDGRADALSTAQRTAIVDAFCRTVANSGYRTGVYASKSWFLNQLSVGSLSSYHIWLAHYTKGAATDYPNRYDMWQYTSSGSVGGISTNVDMNLSYLNY